MTTPEMVAKLRQRQSQIIDGKNVFGEIADRLEALHLVSCPAAQLKDLWPVVLYFETDADRAGFVEMVQQANPNLKSHNL